mmetsp:Transcript_5960/g.10577  ORF Transcript_5960/g.10577 Transcript_5960/m.10577 type:complete len:352 (-) Transcript_5960:297-1352(-)|eukprot:CAMPEP_0182450968 /NCGR_PEP_ID=MMETSP1172-20130603/43465_1 /TAXON_ID=708627 /ORGANISM="Timspurckia oligopyrenoides, Strain CCMP3278" /LENGTH=351 /DNA_ID=CAMNT_0024648697 /DNA_START=52 /DNA_END=1107 /DNA_ORIENTATION=+
MGLTYRFRFEAFGLYKYTPTKFPKAHIQKHSLENIQIKILDPSSINSQGPEHFNELYSSEILSGSIIKWSDSYVLNLQNTSEINTKSIAICIFQKNTKSAENSESHGFTHWFNALFKTAVEFKTQKQLFGEKLPLKTLVQREGVYTFRNVLNESNMLVNVDEKLKNEVLEVSMLKVYMERIDGIVSKFSKSLVIHPEIEVNSDVEKLLLEVYRNFRFDYTRKTEGSPENAMDDDNGTSILVYRSKVMGRKKKGEENSDVFSSVELGIDEICFGEYESVFTIVIYDVTRSILEKELIGMLKEMSLKKLMEFGVDTKIPMDVEMDQEGMSYAIEDQLRSVQSTKMFIRFMLSS